MADRSPLTTTSYAILGLLAVRPWTTYELTKQMGRSLRRFWPRAESKLYEEPRKLVDHGLATATEARTGGRRRTVYAITADGRAALRAWLDEPGAGPTLECEALVKVFFAEHGTKRQLLTHVDELHRWAATTLAADARLVQGYLDAGAPFPERLAVATLVGTLLTELAVTVERWSSWARAEVEGWPRVRNAEPAWDAIRAVAALGDVHGDGTPRGGQDDDRHDGGRPSVIPRWPTSRA